MKQWIRGTNAAVFSIAVVGIFIVLTVFLNSVKGLQWDWTENKRFTLADQTLTVLEELQLPVHIVSFISQDPYMDRQVADLLKEYEKRSSLISFEEIDPVQQPSMAQKYQVTQLGTIIFESGEKTSSLSSYELFGYGSTDTTYSFSGEQRFTQAIKNLTSDDLRPLYFLTGHGEFTSSELPAFRQSLEGEGYEVRDLNLLREGALPEDAETILVLSPQSDLSEEEAGLLKPFLAADGRLLMTIDLVPDMDQWTQWDALLGEYGIVNEQALVVEASQTLIKDPLAIVPEFGIHDIVNKLGQEDRVAILPAAMALSSGAASEESGESYVTALLKTSSQAHGKKELGAIWSGTMTEEDLEPAEGDLTGPLHLAYAVEDEQGEAQAVVIGNGVFLQDQMLAQQGNRDFILNSVGWLHGQTNEMTIRPREEALLQQVYITRQQGNLIFTLTVMVLPIVFLVMGAIVWWRRKKG
ncbi:GldG family protein [Paenibacillus senegalensis]|uniref:GldG family protein n=1 Tax=Paenibacillus senegalensis TaxID=1465766 RepID=UPI000289CA91|nr:GldG family protein [Paenibacillus senegalensis]